MLSERAWQEFEQTVKTRRGVFIEELQYKDKELVEKGRMISEFMKE